MLNSGRLAVMVLRSRAPVVLGVAGACITASVAYGILAPDRYEATATLFIESGATDASMVGGPGASARGNELDLLRSERVAQRVVEDERLAQDPALRTPYLESIDAGRPPIEALAQYLAARMQASAGADGGVVQLSVTLSDPQLAMRVANAYAQAWGEVSLELRAASIRSGVERAHQDLALLRARLGEAQARRGDGTLALSVGARANEQFDQLSRIAHQLPRPLSVDVAAAAGGAAGWKRTMSASLTAGDAATEPYDPAKPARRYPDALADGASMQGADVPGAVKPAAAPAGRAASVDDDIRFAQQSLEHAEERLARISAEGIGAPFPAHLLRAARLPEGSTKPSLGLCLVLGAILGALLGMLAAAVVEMFDRRVRRASDLSQGLGVVVLGKLPAARRAGAAAGVLAPRWPALQRNEGVA